MKKYVRLLPLVGLMLAGCAQSDQQEESVALPSATTNVPAAPGSTLLGDVPLARLLRATGHPVIYEGTLELEVSDFGATSAQLDTVLSRRGAYLTQAHETTTEERHEQTLTIKVPSAQFLALTAELTCLGMVHNKNLTSRDIGAELAKLRGGTPTPKAGAAASADTVVTIARRAQEQLLMEQASLATLNLTYYQLRSASDVSPAPALAPRLVAGLRFGWQLVSSVLVGAAYIWPALLLAGGLLWYQRRLAQKRLI
jgi:hypothetical protein